MKQPQIFHIEGDHQPIPIMFTPTLEIKLAGITQILHTSPGKNYIQENGEVF